MKTESLIRLSASALLAALAVQSTAGTEPAPREHVIEITEFKFIPEQIVVAPGDRITWINRDIVPHTASSTDGSWDTGTLLQNESKSVAVSESMPGGRYFCRFHPSMTAEISGGEQ